MIDRLLQLDWLVLGLRVLFVGLLYLFLYQILRFGIRELAAAAGAAVPPPAARLVVVDGAAAGLAAGSGYPLVSGVRLGRHPTNAIAIDDAFLSGEHAEFAFADGRWWVRDLGSTNGTRVNGKSVARAVPIRPGDVVQCGRVTMQLVPASGGGRREGSR